MWVEGAVDLHVHTAPDIYDRLLDDVALAIDARDSGMRAVLLKNHHTLTADRAGIAARISGFEVYGGLALNLSVGGLNPVAVETAIEFGARQIWMPTVHAAHCMAVAEQPMFRAEAARGRHGITILDRQGALVPEALHILELIRDADIALGTGHLSPSESMLLLRTARDMGLGRMLVTHPLMSFTRFSPAAMQEAAALGALLEFDYLSCSPKWHGAVDPDESAAAMRQVGFRHCVMASDGGQPYNPPPAQMLQDFAGAMHERGIGKDALHMMMCENPCRVLGL